MPLAITIKPPPLLEWQLDVKRSSARFKVVCVGRRAGKTKGGEVEALETALTGGIVWWIAPVYAQGAIGWRGIKQLCRQIPGTAPREADRIMHFPSGGFIQVKTGDDPNNLKGEGLDLAVFDEAALVKMAAWTESVRPALSDKQGRALFLSTPKGIGNWFYRIFGYGLDPAFPDWQSWQLPTSVNPYIPLSEIEAARADMPERLFRQEYLAEFIEDSGAVFRHVDQVSTLVPLDQAIPGHVYIAGLDWGKVDDFTAFSIWDKTERCEVYLDRFNKIEWQYQRDRIRQIASRFNISTIWAESNSIGGPNIEALQSEGLNVVPFETTASSKGELINGLALSIEKPDVKLLSDPVATMELKSYELERLPSGKFRYGAPEGMHDDTVIARCLARHGLFNGGWYAVL